MMRNARVGRRLVRALVASVAVGIATPLRAQDPLVAPAPDASNGTTWSLGITPYTWLAAQSTDVGGRALRQSFTDLASITNLGFQGRVAARIGRIILQGDYTYADQESNTAIGRTSIDMGVRQHIVDLKVGYPVYDSRPPAMDGGLGLWVGVGGRYWNNATEFVITREPILPGGEVVVVEEEADQVWWDPVVALFAHWPVTPRVGFAARGTVGGFGIGNASSYLWDGEGVATFGLGRRFVLAAGYRAFRYDRTDGEGDEEVTQNVTVTGLILGLSVGVF